MAPSSIAGGRRAARGSLAQFHPSPSTQVASGFASRKSAIRPRIWSSDVAPASCDRVRVGAQAHVVVGVHEAGQHRGAARVDHLGGRPDQPPTSASVPTHVDPAAADAIASALGIGVVHGVDAPVPHDQVGRAVGGAAAHPPSSWFRHRLRGRLEVPIERLARLGRGRERVQRRPHVREPVVALPRTDRERDVPHPQARVPALLAVGGRAAPVLAEEQGESSPRPRQVR